MNGETMPFGGSRFTIEGEALVGLPSGAAWWAAARTLIVADLHFEKGSSFARRGSLLPPFDTGATLARLEADVAALAPARVISLGDAFHDPYAAERLDATARDRIARLQSGRDWLWIDGNHDVATTAAIGGERVGEIAIGSLTFRHEPAPGATAAATGEVAGHLHPAARARVASGSVRRHCFATDGRRVILPAYGCLAGGLDLASRAFAGLFRPERLVAHLLGAGRVHAMPASALVGVSRDGTAPRRANR